MQTHRDDAFVPLAPAALAPSERPDFRVTLLRQPAGAEPFQGLAQSLACPAAPQSSGHDATVSLVRDGDRITAIQVRCACGRIVELACVYEVAPPTPAPAAAPAPAAPAPAMAPPATAPASAPATAPASAAAPETAMPPAAAPSADPASAATDPSRARPASGKTRGK